MEKTALLLPRQSPRAETQLQPARLTVSQRVVLLFVVLIYGYRICWFLVPHTWTTTQKPLINDLNTTDFDWFQTPSQSYLKYYPCYQDDKASFECARLNVPLDHFNGTTKAEISLAIIRLPAAVPPSHPNYGGAILFNPGGPGGSGIDFLLGDRKSEASAIHGGQEANDTKFYDFISFDPRGVGYSSPMVSCFDSTILSWAWALRVWQEGILGSSDAAFGRLWSMSRALGGSCSLSADHDAMDIKKFVSTASVAADMVEIVERHGEWREAEAKRILRVQNVPESLKHHPGKEKLNYWGFSYGTYLGMTFASMYPDRISRFIIDGVVDAEDYVKALWFDNLADTEKEMKSFYDYCASAGFPACALANKTADSTGADIEARVSNILYGLIHNPLPVIGESPEVITHSDVRHLIFAGLYSPMASFPNIADILIDIESGNGTSMAARLKEIHQPTCPSTDATDMTALKTPARKPRRLSLSSEASTSISCSDGDPQSGSTREDIRKHWEDLTRMSPTIGPIWAMFRMRCTHYTVRPLYRFIGPWTANTSFPILFIGNSADPVTPVRNARKMSKGYKNSRVLEQKSSGHCSSSAPSKCTREIVYAYVQHGELPDHDTQCEVDSYPFETRSEQESFIGGVSSRDSLYGLAGVLMPAI